MARLRAHRPLLDTCPSPDLPLRGLDLSFRGRALPRRGQDLSLPGLDVSLRARDLPLRALDARLSRGVPDARHGPWTSNR
ncbi:hypothetical protein GCM10010177_69280 [Actinomadura citrea]|nr:hypothetical protein GCM10010177_69280 [Actinomadura citrea]